MSTSWLEPPENLNLTSGHIDIWRTSLDISTVKVKGYYELLDSEEKTRVNNYKSSKRSNEFIITRGVLRKTIADLFKVPPSSFQFKYTDKDKPFLKTDILGVPLSFNISHSSDHALIAMGFERKLGVDIERIRNNVDFKKLARRFFSKQESEALENYPDTSIPSAFFSCWSRKEAFVKALGDGISFGLSEFTVSIHPEQSEIKLETHYDPLATDDWCINNIPAGNEYAAAICSNRPNYEIRLWQVEHKL